MTEAIARRMLVSDGHTEEERRLARLWLLQRRLFPGDGQLLERLTAPDPLMVTIGEVLRWRAGLSA